MNRILISSLNHLRFSCFTPSSSRLQRLNLSFIQSSRRSFCSATSGEAATKCDNEDDDNQRTEKPNQASRENITTRLLRLSVQDPEEFEPTVDPEEAEHLRWEKYKDCFPDQRIRNSFPSQQRGSFSNPNSRYASRNNFQGSSYQGTTPHRDGGRYPKPGYGKYQQQQNSRGLRDYEEEEEDVEEAQFNEDLRIRRSQADPRRYNGRFESDWVPKPKEKAPKKTRGGRVNAMGELEDEEEVNYQKLMKDYDLDESDLPPEPRQSASARFANEQNREAIKEAYLKKFKAGGQMEVKRDFHSHAADRYFQGPVAGEASISNMASLNVISSTESKRASPAAKSRRKQRNSYDETESKFGLEDRATDALAGGDDNADTFGHLNAGSSESSSPLELKYDVSEIGSIPDESIYDDLEEDDSSFRPEDRMSLRKLKFSITNLLKEKKLKEALDLFTTAMKEGGISYKKSELEYLFRCLITECAKAGHAKMAFKLHALMKKRGLWVKPAVYTSLFNACSNATWIASECKIKMSYLREQMERKGYQPNLINYHAMIKAYGRCGDIESAFAVADEMRERRSKLVRPDADTFCFLLQACVTDTKNGFRNALITWDKMRRMKIRPKIYAYNLLLRATRECGVSIPEDIQEQVELRRKDRLALRACITDEKDLEMVEEITAKTIDPTVVQAKMVASDSLSVSNLARLQDCVSLITSDRFETNSGPAKVIRTDKKSQIMLSDEALDAVELLNRGDYRALMLGGVRGILQQMKGDKVKPDLKTFQELLLLSRPLEIWDVVSLLDECKVEPEISFYNVLIRKLVFCGRSGEVKQVVQLMNNRRVNPDIFTWSALAFSCSNWFAAKELVENMEASKFTLNTEVVGALASQAARYLDPLYFVQLMKMMDKDEVPATKKTLDQIEKFNKIARESVIQLETGQNITNPVMRKKLTDNADEFLEQYKIFRVNYRQWAHKADILLEPEDPWDEDFKARYPPKKLLNDASLEVEESPR